MRLKFELSDKEIKALQAMSSQAAGDATVMIDDGKEGGQLKQGYLIEEGIAVLDAIIKLARG